MPLNPRITPASYDDIYARRGERNFLNELDREVLGDQRASLTSTGFLSNRDFSRYQAILARYLNQMSPACRRGTLLDLGCGVGGLGRELASVLGLDLIGVDFSSVAIAQARTASKTQLQGETRFEVADFSATGIEDQHISAVISLDALYLATNPVSALAEIRRLLVLGGPLLFTAYVERPPTGDGNVRVAADRWTQMLKDSGFIVVRRNDITKQWRRFMLIKHQRRWLERERIKKDLGKLGEAELSVTVAMLGLNGKPSFLESVNRFEFVCRRRASD
ncbi:MAG: class I SAM-dependent methyltransferase [Pyrinomonadaceae bacterium]|nr:class I SAM-dependent methyltransferase [Pyrinomonadaceae bacterium]